MSSSESSKFICQICGYKHSHHIPYTHPEQHGITMAEYQLLFGENPDAYIQCQYFNEDTGYQCNLNKYSDSPENFCILHHPTKDKDHDLFNRILEILIKTWIHDKNEFHLEGTYFPVEFRLADKTIENKAYFTDCYFCKEVEIKTIFKDRTLFGKCIFEKSASVMSI